MAFSRSNRAGPRDRTAPPFGRPSESPAPRPAPRPAGKPPSEPRLREAALLHLSRYATTQAGLARVLGNKLRRWARAAEAEGQDTAAALAEGLAAAARIAAGLVEAGAVDDAGFAATRTHRLARAGRSRRATAAHLASKGVARDHAAAAMEDAPPEADVALALCRKRRIGPFAREAPDAALRLKWLGILARAGFSRDLALAALDTDPDEADARVIALKQ